MLLVSAALRGLTRRWRRPAAWPDAERRLPPQDAARAAAVDQGRRAARRAHALLRLRVILLMRYDAHPGDLPPVQVAFDRTPAPRSRARWRRRYSCLAREPLAAVTAAGWDSGNRVWGAPPRPLAPAPRSYCTAVVMPAVPAASTCLLAQCSTAPRCHGEARVNSDAVFGARRTRRSWQGPDQAVSDPLIDTADRPARAHGLRRERRA